jgi:Xaa-Pro aminopeptidase
MGVSMLRFPKGTKGYQMDILARKALWDFGLNYGHGTGHGVGFFLNVHEGPQTIGSGASGHMSTSMQPGMVTSVEPAIYRDGQYGMRTENVTLVIEDIENEFGTFYCFETLTLAPIDHNLINPELLSPKEKEWLNAYHQDVFEKLGPALNEDERMWLKKSTRTI